MPVISVRRCSRIVALAAAAFVSLGGGRVAFGQTPTLVVDGPVGPTLSTLSPSFTLRVLGLPANVRPSQYTLFISRTPIFGNSFEQTISVAGSLDTIVTLRVRKLLPSSTQIYWKGRVTMEDGTTIESVVSTARQTPPWLTQLEPKPLAGGKYQTRRPRFVWQSGKVDADFGAWSYELQVVSSTGDVAFTVSGLSDTTFVASTELQANTLYSWSLRATLASTGDAISLTSPARFQIEDKAVPTTTLLYQNFPNPFPSLSAFATCFWFDIGSAGAIVTMDILDVRGSLVKTIVPARRFLPGRYGVGDAGSGSNCDNSFTWNGTATDGRTVPAGVYLLRFKAGPKMFFKKILFTGR